MDPAIVEELVTRTGAAGQLAGLTDREREVLGLIAEGFSDAVIAERMNLSQDEVEKNVEQIFLKLGVRDEDASHRRVAACSPICARRWCAERATAWAHVPHRA